jgi:predicted nucleic acid-binding protein
MANEPERAVWDSCVVLDALDRTKGRYEKIAPFLADAELGRFIIVLSEITIAEVSYLPSNPGASEAALQIIQRWFENPYIVRRPVHNEISRVAAEIGRQHRVKRAADRVVLATAIVEHVRTVHTFDEGLWALDQMIGNPPLRIGEPDYGAGTLFEGKL